MRTMKKFAASILCLCMMALAIPNVAQAASAELRFSDPSTTVGATVEITAKFSADAGIEDVNATLSYDGSFLKYVSGDNTSGGDGTVTLTGAGGGAEELNWSIQFQALQEGSSVIEISDVTANDSDGASITVTRGTSTVTIGPGDPSLITDDAAGAAPAAAAASATDGNGGITIDGQSYVVNNEFSDVLIPEGFTKTEMQFEGQTVQATMQESSGLYAMYLKNNANGESDFYLYNPDDGSFAQFEQILITDERFIVLLSDDMSKELPSNLQATTLTVNGKEFPAWQNVDATDYYVVYALNSDGKKGFYQYDSVDGTYQRYTVESADSKEDNSPTSLVGKVIDWLRNNMDKFLIGVWAVFLLMLLILIVVGVKLRHRNEELDDLYDEYGIDDEEEIPAKPAKLTKKEKKAMKEQQKPNKKEPKNKKKRKADEDDFYDFEDEDDDYADLEDEYEEDEYDDSPYDEVVEDKEPEIAGADDDSEIDDLDSALNARVRKPEPRRKVSDETLVIPSHSEDDDIFKVDFVDLD